MLAILIGGLEESKRHDQAAPLVHRNMGQVRLWRQNRAARGRGTPHLLQKYAQRPAPEQPAKGQHQQVRQRDSRPSASHAQTTHQAAPLEAQPSVSVVLSTSRILSPPWLWLSSVLVRQSAAPVSGVVERFCQRRFDALSSSVAATSASVVPSSCGRCLHRHHPRPHPSLHPLSIKSGVGKEDGGKKKYGLNGRRSEQNPEWTHGQQQKTQQTAKTQHVFVRAGKKTITFRSPVTTHMERVRFRNAHHTLHPDRLSSSTSSPSSIAERSAE